MTADGKMVCEEAPVEDPMKALQLLYTRYIDQLHAPAKELMPYAVLGPSPHGTPPEKYRYFPFVEWSWYGGICGLELLGTRHHCLSSQVADRLIREGWVEEIRPLVYTISLLGIAVYAADRKKQFENAIGIGGNDK